VEKSLEVMWEKLVHLSTAAATTCLMRANVGEIVRTPNGRELSSTSFSVVPPSQPPKLISRNDSTIRLCCIKATRSWI
jgi:hypothetical protein